ncbi:MAG: hypothetical protein PHI67_11015 [Candidatus Methanomethylophilaceae archaeon]|nr:hypothetical protein [Candidatus Methanomethylophilaceae archaeon]
MPLDWDMVVKRYTEQPYIITIARKKEHPVAKVTETALIIDLPGRDQSVSRKKLESAVKLIESGHKIRTVKDYRKMVADERPSYALAILHDLGYI